VGPHRSGDQLEGVMYTGTGDGRWDPENGVYGNGMIGVKQNPQTRRWNSWIITAHQRRMAGKARPGYAGHACDLQLQEQGLMVDASKGVPPFT